MASPRSSKPLWKSTCQTLKLKTRFPEELNQIYKIRSDLAHGAKLLLPISNTHSKLSCRAGGKLGGVKRAVAHFESP